MSNANLKTLADAGIAVDLLPAEQRDVLESLSPEEMSVLIKVQQKVHTDDVVGQSADMVVGGILF